MVIKVIFTKNEWENVYKIMISESLRNKMVCVYTNRFIKQKKYYTDKNMIFSVHLGVNFSSFHICIFSKYSIMTAYSISFLNKKSFSKFLSWFSMPCSVPVFFLTKRVEIKVLVPLFSRLVECEYTRLMWKPPLGWSRSSLVWAHPGWFLSRQILQLPVLGVDYPRCKAHLLFLAQWAFRERGAEPAALRLEGSGNLWGRKSSGG